MFPENRQEDTNNTNASGSLQDVNNLLGQSPAKTTVDILEQPDDLKGFLKSLSSSSNQLKKDIGKLKTRNKNLKDLVDKSIDEFKELKKRFMEVLGLFGTFITFVLANVTVFSRIDNISIAIVFMGLMLLCMLVFLYGITLILEREDGALRARLRKFIGVTTLGVFLASLAMFLLEKSVVSVVTAYREGKPICVNCHIDKDCNIVKTSPGLFENKK